MRICWSAGPRWPSFRLENACKQDDTQYQPSRVVRMVYTCPVRDSRLFDMDSWEEYILVNRDPIHSWLDCNVPTHSRWMYVRVFSILSKFLREFGKQVGITVYLSLTSFMPGCGMSCTSFPRSHRLRRKGTDWFSSQRKNAGWLDIFQKWIPLPYLVSFITESSY